MPGFKKTNSDITLSCNFIKNIMPELNGAYVKVYLYILMLANAGLNMENSEIAGKLGLLESEVVHSFDILSQCGLINISGDMITIGDAKDYPNQMPVQKPAVTSTKDVKVHYSSTEMAAELEANKSLSDMLKIAQEVMGKPLNNSDINTLFWFYDALGFSPEVILMLLEYCVSADKRSMPYIEKVAISWHDKGIKTIEDAEKLDSLEQEALSYTSTIKRLIGINDRNLTKIEEKFLLEWKNEDNMSEEMVALAYEYCILQINKLSFPYMNKIIKRWKSSGIFTVEDAEYDNETFRNKAGDIDSPPSAEKDDYTAIERRMWDSLS